MLTLETLAGSPCAIRCTGSSVTPGSPGKVGRSPVNVRVTSYMRPYDVSRLISTRYRFQAVSSTIRLRHAPISMQTVRQPIRFWFGARLIMDGWKREHGCQARRRGQHTRDGVQQQCGGSLVAMQATVDDQIHRRRRIDLDGVIGVACANRRLPGEIEHFAPVHPALRDLP